MKKRIHLLPTLLLLSSLFVAGLGGYIKYGILEPLGIHREESIVAMPFVLYSDKGLQFMIEVNRGMALQDHVDASEPTVQTVEPTTTSATEIPTTAATEAPTEAPDTQPATDPAATENTVPDTSEPVTEAPTEPPTEPPTEAPTEPVYVELEDSWFEDMLVIGDSRIHGMRNYYRFGNAYYFTSVGMNIYNVFGVWEGDQGHYECSLDETLKTIPFGKVLIGIGLNECNYDHTYIQAGFEKLINLIHSYQPDCKIILTSIMMVSEKYSRRDECFSIENLTAINEIMKSLADGESVFYLETNEWIVDESGYLSDEVTFDGVHLYGFQYVEWATWMRRKLGTLGIP